MSNAKCTGDQDCPEHWGDCSLYTYVEKSPHPPYRMEARTSVEEYKELMRVVAKAGAVVTDTVHLDGSDGHTAQLVSVYKLAALRTALEDLLGEVK